jgi:hypothetical protein
MSEQTNYCTLKGLGWAMLIITFLLIGVPLLTSIAVMGPEEYAQKCNMSVITPCFGLGND